MFLLLLIAPFVLLAIAALIAKRGAVGRSALALIGLFLAIDVLMFWTLFAGPQTSTSAIALGIVCAAEVLVALAVLVISLFARRKAAKVQ